MTMIVTGCGECHAHWHRMMDSYRITAPRVRHG